MKSFTQCVGAVPVDVVTTIFGSVPHVPFRPLGDRVVISADIEDHAPQQTESGLLTATSLAAAVQGSDAEDSWFVGTIVAIGPLVNRFDVREYVSRRLNEIEFGHRYLDELMAEFQREFKALPDDCPDPVHVGDRVTFSWAAGQQITVDGTKFIIMRQRDVLAVLDPDESE